jgi:hypothetical protein
MQAREPSDHAELMAKLAPLAGLAQNMAALSCTSLIRLIYKPEDVPQLLNQYEQLRQADDQAFSALNQAYQHTDADQRGTATSAALEARRVCLAAIEAFRNQHPLMVELAQHNTAKKRLGE